MKDTFKPEQYQYFEKIKFQDILAKRLLASNLKDLVGMDQQFDSIPNVPLEEITDVENVDAYLNQLAELAESRLQFALLKAKDGEQTLFHAGKVAGAGKDLKTVREIALELDMLFLDGKAGEDAIAYEFDDEANTLRVKQLMDVHASLSEEEQNLDFYAARRLFIEGFLSESAFKVRQENPREYFISK